MYEVFSDFCEWLIVVWDNMLIFADVSCEYVRWTTPRRKKIDLYCALFRQSFDWDTTAVKLYGMVFELAMDMVLVTAEIVEAYPGIGF